MITLMICNLLRQRIALKSGEQIDAVVVRNERTSIQGGCGVVVSYHPVFKYEVGGQVHFKGLIKYSSHQTAHSLPERFSEF